MTSLTNDVTALGWPLERTSGPLVRVGHAYSGAVMAAVKEERVKSLVYIVALAPDEGETVAKVFYRDPKPPESPKLAPDAHGFIWIPDGGFRAAVAHKASAEQASIAQAVQRPINVQCIQEPAPTPAWKTKPSWFLIAEEDRMINPKTQHFMAESDARESSCAPGGPQPHVLRTASRDRRDSGGGGPKPLAIVSVWNERNVRLKKDRI
jgi:pimeloyl-ACP methyl ester carboxylesterase